MSDGIVHRNSSVLLAAGFIVGGIVWRDIQCVEYAVGSLVGIMATPDWDVDRAYIGNTYVKKTSRVANFILNAFLYVYRKSIKHGSPLSHWPVLGTIFRILYSYVILVALPTIVYTIFTTNTIDTTTIISRSWEILIVDRWRLYLSLAGSDFIHYILDIITTNNSVWGMMRGVMRGRVRVS